ncbi:MAG: response regulator [Myxococcales bacterium]|nr:response regulator [Myxococcales bacterium]
MTESASGPVILLVEDEPQMRRFLRAALSSHAFRLVEAGSGTEAIALATSHNPEVVLLDLGLPDIDGLEVTRRLREFTKVPILVLSARGREDDKVAALDAGADDYVTKPFGTNELLARLRVALRHAQGEAKAEPVFELGSLRIDYARREVTKAGEVVKLTPIEYRLLTCLAKNLGKVLIHRYLLKEVWGPTHGDDTHYLRVYMAQLRRKLEDDASNPTFLLTEPGVGYRMKG